MRVLPILGISAVVIFAGYTGLWYVNGKADLREVEKQLGALAENPNVETLSYQSLKLEGYPFSIKVVIEKPRIKVKLNAILDALKGMMPFHETKTPPVSLDIFASESAVIKTNAFGSYYTLETFGDVMTVVQGEKDAIHFKQTQDENEIVVKLKFWSALFGHSNLEKLAQLERAELLDLVKKIGTKTTNHTLSDALTNQTILTADKVAYSIRHKSVDEGYVDVALDYDVKNYKTDKAFVEAMTKFNTIVGSPTTNVKAHASLSNATSKGTFHYAGPVSKDSFLAMEKPIDLDMDFDYDNDLYNLKHKGQFKVGYEDSAFDKASVESKGTLLFKPGSHESLVDLYSEILDDMPMAELDSEQQSVKDFVKKNLNTLVPKLEELGIIKMNADVNMQSQGPLVTLAVNNVSAKNDLYGVVVTGELKANPLIPIPAGQINIVMDHMNAFFDRADKYVQLAINYHKEQDKPLPPYLSDKTVSKVKEFLNAIATKQDGDETTWNIVFIQKEPFVQVGDKKASDIEALFSRIFLSQDDSQQASPAVETEPEAAQKPADEQAAAPGVEEQQPGASEQPVENETQEEVTSEE